MMRTTENFHKSSTTLNPKAAPKGRYIYLEVFLQGGAPWGFTLKGGLEHGEPLIISKIEEGGKADSVSSKLRAGDEVVHINEVALTSSRREAVSLVKGSYKTLRLVVRRDTCADEGHADTTTSNSFSPEHLTSDPQHRKATWSGGVKLRLKHRRSEPPGRPHSWHSTKFGENQPDASMMQISQGTIGTPWHQSYHSSSSTSDLSNYDHAYLRRSPDRCSSQGSMESLEPSTGYPPCHLLSPAKSTSSIDQLSHLHNKRDSAYSSFSTSSSILEYPPPGISGRERSGSMDTTSARGGLLEGMRQADIRYVKTVYDTRRGVSEEYEVNSSAVLQGREARASAEGQSYDKWHNVPRGRGIPPPSWNQHCPSSLETGTDNPPSKVSAPLPPARSDSYAAIRHRERPSSWSSLDQKRFCRPQANSSGSLKSPFIEEQLHTVLEKSPESSPPVKPKHNYTQKAQPGQPLLPTGIYPVPSVEPHFAQVPQPSMNSNGMLYPALAKESGYTAPQAAYDKMATFDENGNQNGSTRPGFAFYQPLEHDSQSPVEKKPENTAKFVPYKVHFPSVPENEEDISLRRHLTSPQGNSPHPSERKSTHSNKPYSNHHSFKSPQVSAWQMEDKRLSRPSEPWEEDFQEDYNANSQKRQEREGLGQSLSRNFGKTKSAFSSLQNIPESLRRPRSLELEGGFQEGYPDGKPASIVNTKAKDFGRKVGPDQRSHLDRPVSYPRPEGRTSISASFHSSEPRYEEPSSPLHQQTSSLGRRRLSSGTASALQGFQYGKPHCSVLEKVSKIEQREQGSQSSSVGCTNYGHTFRPNRTVSTSSTSGNELEEARANIRFSESTEPLSNGEQHFKNRETKLEEVSWQPCSQQLRRGADGGRGPPFRGGETSRRDACLLRSQSTFQLSSEAENEAMWPDDRPGTPESPLLDAPFSRAYRNSIKDAQSRVLGATSFRRKDLELGAPGASRPWRPRPASAHVGLRSPEAPAVLSPSPHTPRERHSVTPIESNPAQPAHPATTRRGARRRLTPEQKKLSYSEPEKMNEVGVLEEAEPTTLGPQRKGLRFPETTVADRRRIFERDGKASSSLSLSGPELKQFQQSALADYIQRKTGKRPSSSSMGCGLQEPGLLREYTQGSYFQLGPMAPEGPGLSGASSLTSLPLPEPSLQPHREANLLLAAAPALGGEPPRAPRDRSSSFAGGRLPRERRHGDPQAPREPTGAELLGGANCGPQGPQRMDRTPGEPPFWGPTARRTGKSKSAEDLLERSDVLAVPVHVRSRSSPTADKKRQDILLGDNQSFGLLMKDPCSLAGTESRSLSCPEQDGEEMPLLIHHPSPHCNGAGCRAVGGLSVPSECPRSLEPQRQARRTPCPRPLPAEMEDCLADTRMGPVTPLSSTLPSSLLSPYCSQAAAQQAGRDGQAGRQPLSPCSPAITLRSNGPTLTQPPRGPESSSPENGIEEAMRKKVSLLHRPPPPRVKWAYTVREDSLPEESLSPEFVNLKHYKKQQSLPSSSSTSDPDTPVGAPSTPGRISLRISESVLQASPPPREEYDDEVFVKDLQPSATYNPTFEALPPPPPPPLSLETLVNSFDDFPPPPPQAVYEAQLDSKANEDPHTSSSKVLTRERPVPGAAHLVGSQTLASRPQDSIKALEANEGNLPSIMEDQLQPAGSVGGEPPLIRTLSLIHDPVSGNQGLEKKVSAGPQKTSEDIRTEALAKEIVHQDKSLADILDPDSRMKTTMDLMEGLFPRDVSLVKENNIKRKALQRAISCSGCEGKRSEEKETVGMLVNCPAYYNMSAPKAELLKKIKDMPEEVNEEEEQADVNEKKAELIGSLTQKLETLQEAKGSVLMDIKLNNALGEEVEALIRELCKPNEFDKYKMFIGDLDKVVNLLLSLSGRLARVENVLSSLGEDASNEERNSLNEKRKVLAGQHEDARELKENLDRRERVVLDILANYFSEEQLQDYQHFVKMKSTLLIEQRKLDDKIKLGQEQVKCLLESLPSDFIPKAGALALPPNLASETAPAGGCTLSSNFPALTSPL
ncbi:protein Shroom3 [Orycteropus afer afer]|uniref:Protein Shroom3 n=1 Tax=Orycteropus afer afer TaxID=1230840 RepID=A0A8B7AM82_ORYAF|nr:protein Shroom3 [Orycteropus afer afer]